MSNETHYVARIVITKVEVASETTSYREPKGAPVRRKSTIASITVSQKDLNLLVELANKHLGLVTDGGDIGLDI